MAETHVVSGLVEKRSELAGLVAHHQQEIGRLEVDLQHLDAAIKLFAPEYDLRGIKRKQYRRYSRLFKQGECYRLCLDALREAGGTATTITLAERLMTAKGIAADQQKTVNDSVNNSLRYAEQSGVIRRAGKDGTSIVWALV